MKEYLGETKVYMRYIFINMAEYFSQPRCTILYRVCTKKSFHLISKKLDKFKKISLPPMIPNCICLILFILYKKLWIAQFHFSFFKIHFLFDLEFVFVLLIFIQFPIDCTFKILTFPLTIHLYLLYYFSHN